MKLFIIYIILVRSSRMNVYVLHSTIIFNLCVNARHAAQTQAVDDMFYEGITSTNIHSEHKHMSSRYYL